MTNGVLLGDLRERSDGGFDGWCWAPDRPDERLIVDLMVNDSVAASMVAAIFRRDLMTSGYGDGRHGFALHLPPNLPEAAEECLITGRERRTGAIFGRVLRRARGFVAPGGERVDQAARSVAAAWQKLDAAGAQLRQEPASARARAAFGLLAERLAAGPRSAAWLPQPLGNAGLPAGPTLVLSDLAEPAFSLVLPVRGAARALRRIAALAAGAAVAGAEIIAVDGAHDPFAALLPGRVRNLRYLRDERAGGVAGAANLAAAHARGRFLVVLDDETGAASSAALLALARIALARPRAVLLGPVASAADLRVGTAAAEVAGRLPARIGLAFCIARDRWDDLGPLEAALDDGAALECADLAFKARVLGLHVLAVTEPAASAETATGAAVPAVAARRALAAFHERWGPPVSVLDRSRRPA